MIEAVDSFYEYVKGRVKIVNSTRKFMGVSDAQDWPPKSLTFEAFYLITMGEVPLGRQAYSATIPVVVHMVQWVWAIKGTDVQAGLQQLSRGDRYRTNFAMKTELLNGLYPYLCEKLEWSVVGASGQLQSAQIDPNSREYIWWSPAQFFTRVDKPSGLIYAGATVRITNMTDAILS